MKILIVTAALVALTFATPVPVGPDITDSAPVVKDGIYQTIIGEPAIVNGEERTAPFAIRRAMSADINSSPASSIVQIILDLDSIRFSQSQNAVDPLPTPVLVPDDVYTSNVMPDISAPANIVEDSIYQSIHYGKTVVDDVKGIAPKATRSPLVADIHSSPGSSIVQVIVNGKTIKRFIDIPQRPNVEDPSPVEISNPELPNPILFPVIVASPELPAPVITLPEVLN